MASPVTEDKSNSELQENTDKILEETASHYAEYLLVDPQREKKKLDEKIEEMLTRLDEFCAVVDMIRTDSSLSLNTSLPDVQTKAQEIRSIFHRIDQLEVFVSVVRDSVAAMEEQVSEVEKDQGALHSIKNLLSSLPVFTLPYKRGAANKQPKKSTPVEIFKTSDYITAEVDTLPPPESSSQDS